MPALMGLRGFACVWVVLCHLVWLANHLSHAPSWLTFAPSAGWVAVDLFFMLSGFILAYMYTRNGTTPGYFPFLKRRLARIYPVHILVLVGVIAVYEGARHLGFSPPPFSWADLLRHLTLTQAWWGAHQDMWNPPSWSLSAEWAAYLMFPAILAATRLLKSPPAKVSVIIAMLLAFCLAMPLWADPVERSLVFGSHIPRAVWLFSVGMLLFQLNESHKRSPRWLGTAGDISFAAIGLILAACYLWQWPVWWVVLAFPLPLLAAARHQGYVARALSHHAWQKLGLWSYAIYMTHLTPLIILYKYLETHPLHLPLPAAIGLLLAITAALVAVGAAVFYLWETPARRWLSRA